MHVKDEGLLHARSCSNRSPSLRSVHARANLVAKYSSLEFFTFLIFQFLDHQPPHYNGRGWGPLQKTFIPHSQVERNTGPLPPKTAV